MKTYIVSVPENEIPFVTGLFKKLRIRSKAMSEEYQEELGLAKQIIKGMKSEDISKEKLLSHFRKNGVDC